MGICDNGHEKLIYERACPLCALAEKHAKETAALQEKISMLNGTIEENENRIEQYRKELGL